MTARLKKRLQTVVGPQHVSDDPADRRAYRRHLGVHEAQLVVWPASASELAQLLELLRGDGATLVPTHRHAMAPTGRRGRAGSAPRRRRVACDLSRMSSVLHLDETSLTVHAQAGIMLHALEDHLAERGLTLGDFPRETFGHPLGALLARCRPELAAARLGPFSGSCLGVSAVLATGRVVRSRIAPRHAAGPDLLHLFLGAEGALGVITGAVLRVHRQPESHGFTATRFPTAAAALAAGLEALRRGTPLAALRVYDAQDARRCLGTEVEALDTEAILVTRTAGPEALCRAAARLLADVTGDGQALPTELAETWWRRRGRSFRERGGKTPEPVVRYAPVGQLHDLFAAAREAVRDRDCGLSLSRIHLAGGCLRATPGGDRHARARTRQLLRQAATGVLGEATAVAPPELTALKASLDPAGVISPGSHPEELPC